MFWIVFLPDLELKRMSFALYGSSLLGQDNGDDWCVYDI